MGQRDQGDDENTLRKEETGGGNGDTGTRGVESTQEIQDSTEKLRIHQWESWGFSTAYS
jgi:hypothetical protein